MQPWTYQVDNESESVWWCQFSTFKESIFYAEAFQWNSMSLSAW